MQRLKIASFIGLFLISCLAPGCSHVIVKPTNYANTDTADINQLLAMQQSSKKRTPFDINQIRIEGLKEVAMTLGAQGALANRSITINKMLEEHHGEMDQVYNFQSLLLAKNVLPPILAEGDRTLHKSDDNTVRLADKTYRIIEPAKFITTPPNWREYLFLTYEKPELPDYTMLPRNDSDTEKQAWQDGINEGWKQGSQQANQIFAANLARLQRDYNGMVLYRRLANYKMISSPIVAETNLGITGGGDEMSINDRFKRITQGSGLVPDTEQWRPAIAEAFTQVAPPQEQPMQVATVVPQMQPQGDPSSYIK